MGEGGGGQLPKKSCTAKLEKKSCTLSQEKISGKLKKILAQPEDEKQFLFEKDSPTPSRSKIKRYVPKES